MTANRHGSATSSKGRSQPAKSSRNRLYVAIAGGFVAVLALVVIGFVALGASRSVPASTLTPGETTHQGTGGSWTNVTPDRLAQMLQTKDFTFVNVKTPYIGEIDRTDLYIPYDQLTARASELPRSKSARVLVYCRSGAESAIASQTLIALGYTNIWNLDGGMTAWQASGRTLVQKSR
ncbi:MAG TPA: rhodanese-like domain-containing protein [Candidatus Limnocylindrales bacterium]